jgi:hypothetical protein
MAASAVNAALTALSFPESFVWRGSPASGVQYPVVAICVYLATIFSLQRFMRDRPPMKLTGVALVHNAVLCALSAAMCIGTLWELAQLGDGPGNWFRSGGGLMASMCDRSGSAMTGRLGIWMYIFYLSKVWLDFPPFLMSFS